MVNCYVIILEEAKSRREHIKAEFGKHSVDFHFFDAVTPKDNEAGLQYFNINDSQVSKLKKTELACLLSHLWVWQKAIDKNLDFIGVFEDDIYLGSEVATLFKDTQWLINIDVLKLEKFHNKVELSLSGLRVNNTDRKLYEILGKNLGTAGYILSKKGCLYMNNYIKNLEYISPIDIVMFDQIKYSKSLNIYQMQPAIVIQDSILNKDDIRFASTIDHNAEKVKLENNLPFNNKFKRELDRLIRSLRMRQLGFK